MPRLLRIIHLILAQIQSATGQAILETSRKKNERTLCLCFQNIGGVPSKAGHIKDEFLRGGISKYDIDIMGVVETNLKWDHIPDEDRLYNRSRYWWESSHLITSHNTNSKERSKKQFGGVVM